MTPLTDNRSRAIAWFEGEITQGKFHELVTCDWDRTGSLMGLLHEVMRLAGANHLTTCSACGCLLMRRALRKGKPTYCQAEKCQAIAKLGRDKPVSLKTVNADFAHSPARELQAYHGGYNE